MQYESMNGEKPRKRRREHSPLLRTLKYTVEEKLEIIQFAKESGNRSAGREYNVAESSIREWRKNEQRLIESLNNPDVRTILTTRAIQNSDKVIEISDTRDNVPSETSDTCFANDSSLSRSPVSSSSPSSSASTPTAELLPLLRSAHESSSSRRKNTKPRKLILDDQ